MLLILSLSALLFSYSYLVIISCELVSYMLVSPPNLKVVAAVNGVIISAFSGILFDFINTITRW